MLQSAGIPDRLRVGEVLALVRSYYRDPRSVADCVALAGLDGLLERPYRHLSGGQQRRVQFALAICGRPRLLFLDEPTTGLDIEARQGIWRAVRELVADGSAVLLTTHYLEEAEALADHVAVVDRGRMVAEGSVAAIRAHVAQRRIRCVSALRCRRGGARGRACARPSATASCCASSPTPPNRWCAACWPPTTACATSRCSAPAWPMPSSNSPAPPQQEAA